MIDFTKILYLIPIPNDDLSKATIFQGYSPGILYSFRHIYLALSLPASINDYIMSKKENVDFAMRGINYHLIVPFTKELVHESNIMEHFFTCIISDDDTFEESLKYCKKSQYEVLHITESNKKSSNAIHINKLNFKIFKSYLKRNCKKYSDQLHPFIKNHIDKNINKMKQWPLVKTKRKYKNHNIIVPGITALRRFKHFTNFNDTPLQGEDNIYIDEMVDLATEITDFRNRFRRSNIHAYPHSIDCIIEFPGRFEMAPNDGGSLKTTNKKSIEEIKSYNKFIQLENNKKRYSHHIAEDEYKSLQKDKFYKFLEGMRIAELNCYTAAISIIATKYCAPTFRLSPKIRESKYDLSRLKGCAEASPNPNQNKKLNSIMRSVQSSLKAGIDDAIIDFIKKSNKIKIVCDYPIEWLNIDGLPLMLHKPTSRLYPVPGNMFMQHATNSTLTLLAARDLQDITIIRSFNEADIIKSHIEMATKLFPYKNLNINIIDVSSEKEFSHEVNNCKSKILIIDCHGTYNKKKGVSLLKIGNENIDVFSLRKKVLFPPIVFISACNTFPLIGRHANVANSILSCGAMSVTATFLPIDSISSSVLVARLLFRIDTYLPILCNDMDRPTSWLDVVFGMFKMAYASELIRSISKHFNKPPEKTKQLLYIANKIINTATEKWSDKIIIEVSKVLSIKIEKIQTFVNDKFAWSEIMSYINIGNPENIIIQGRTQNAIMNNEQTKDTIQPFNFTI